MLCLAATWPGLTESRRAGQWQWEEAGEPEEVGRLCSSFLPTEQDRLPWSQTGSSELPSVAAFPSGGVALGLSQGPLPH